MTAKERCRCGMTDTPCQNKRALRRINGYSRCWTCLAGFHVDHKET